MAGKEGGGGTLLGEAAMVLERIVASAVKQLEREGENAADLVGRADRLARAVRSVALAQHAVDRGLAIRMRAAVDVERALGSRPEPSKGEEEAARGADDDVAEDDLGAMRRELSRSLDVCAELFRTRWAGFGGLGAGGEGDDGPEPPVRDVLAA